VSAVDAPPGIAFGGRATGEFVARPASLKLARRALVFVILAGAASIAANRGRHVSGSDTLMSAHLVTVALGMVAYAVRRARLRIDGAGVRWGWNAIGFRVAKEALADAVAYDDAIAFRRRRGSTWYLARHDFADFERIPGALGAAGIRFERVARRAPFRSRLQTYGIALDALLVVDILVAAGTLFLVLGG
jgi:hypothetical protein